MEVEKENNLQRYPLFDNKYIIIKKIDEGGFSKVYLGIDKDTKIKYAIKILKKGTTPKIEYASFLKEVNILECLCDKKEEEKINKYIPNLKEHGQCVFKYGENNIEKKYYYVTDYIQNKTLYEYMKATKSGFSEIYTKILFQKILKGVKYCHDKGIYHLDLHLKNILLDENFEPKIIDFGLSLEKKYSDGFGNFERLSYTGKPRCPEHFEYKNFNKFNGEAVDVFCLGISLFLLVTRMFGFNPDLNNKGKKDFYKYIKRENYEKYWDKLIKENPLLSKLSNEFKKLYFSMVAYNPEKRPKINDILKDPWLDEINKLNEEEYKKLELKLNEYLIQLKDSFDKQNNETIINKNEGKDNNKNENNGNKDINNDDKIYFDSNINLKYIYEKGYNAKNYITIEGKLDPTSFMNKLLNKIRKDNIEICTIDGNKYKLKANIKFENKNEEDDDTEKENYFESDEEDSDEENYDDDSEDNNNDYNNNIIKSDEEKENERNDDCIICIKLYQCTNGGYELNFIRKNGDIEDYYKYFDEIKDIIKQILA